MALPAKPKPAAKGDPAPPLVEPTDTPEEAKTSISLSDADLFVKVGLAVFLLAATLAVCLLAVSIFTTEDTKMLNWVRFRSVELLAMVAAVGVVVALIARSGNPFVNTFGIMLIGALIIPTKDMVYLALLATGREMSSEVGGPQTNDGSELKGRDTDLAQRIVSTLHQTALAAGERVYLPEDAILSLTPKQRSVAIKAIRDTIERERVTTSLERVRYGGSLSLLLSFAEDDGYQEFYYRFKNEDEFLIDLQTLRSQELVQFAYTDVNGATVTHLGKRVICEYYAVFQVGRQCPWPLARSSLDVTMDEIVVEAPIVIEEPFIVPLLPCEKEYASAEPLVLVADTAKTVAGDSFLSFIIDEDGPALWGFELKTVDNDNGRADPSLSIYKHDAGECDFVDVNDDGGGGFDARLNVSHFEQGEYLIVIEDLMGRGNDMELVVLGGN